MVHAAVAALHAFAFNVLWNLLHTPGDILKVMERRSFLHRSNVPAGFSHRACVVQHIALTPKNQAR